MEAGSTTWLSIPSLCRTRWIQNPSSPASWMTMMGKTCPVRARAFSWSWDKRARRPAMSPLRTECFDIFSPPPGAREVMTQVERLSSRDTKIALRSVRIAAWSSGRGQRACMVAPKWVVQHPHSARERGATNRAHGIFKVIAVAASMGEAALLPRLVRQDAPDAALGPLLTRNIALMLFLTVPAAVAFGVLARPFAELALAPDFRPGFLAAAGFAVGAAALYTLQTSVLRPAFQLGLKTAPLVQAALLALAIDVLGLFALKAQGATGVMMAHLLGLGGGAALLLGRTLIGLKVRWPVADTLKLAISGALMAAAGWFASARFTPALLAIMAAGVAMAAAFS